MECSHRTPSFGRVEWVFGRFGPKKALLGHKMRSFGRAGPGSTKLILCAQRALAQLIVFCAKSQDLEPLARLGVPILRHQQLLLETWVQYIVIKYIDIHIYYYTPLPLNLANKPATSKQQASNNKHLSFPFWPLRGLIAPGSTLL